MANAYYATQTNRTLNEGEQPLLSHGLEAYRTYQWEVEIDTGVDGDETKLTLAAKKVGEISFSTETIKVDRVNDRYHYPGRASTETVTITFDNLVKGAVAEQLYDWMSSVYDPIHGTFTPGFMQGEGSFKRNIQIYLLDNSMFPVKHITLYGAYPKSWKLSEFNYSQSEFHTLEVELQFDFAVQYSGL